LKELIKKELNRKVALKSHLFLLAFLCFIFIPSPSYCYYKFSPKIEQAYQEFLKLKISSGEKLINEALKEEPQNAMAVFIANYGDFLKLTIIEDAKAYENLGKREEERLTILEKDKVTTSPYYLFAQAELRMQWGFIKLRYNDYMSGLFEIKEAYQLFKENEKKFPLFLPNKKSLGLLNILIGSVPQVYSPLLILAGIKGTHAKGAKLLKEASEGDSPFRLEAVIIKAVTDAFILNGETEKNYILEKECKTHPDNLLAIFVYSTILHKHSKDEEALKIISLAPVSADYINFPFIELLKGDLFLNKLDYANSQVHFTQFLQKNTGLNYIKDAYYKLFLCFWLTNDNTQAEKSLAKVLTTGQTQLDSDKYAQKFAETKNYPDKALMKARLLCDGGYYQQSFACIDNYVPTNKKDSMELTYRKARIYQGMDKRDEAIALYKQTIKISPNSGYYFAPNSCLQLGYLYRKVNNKEAAKQYFLEAMSYEDYEYKNSIETKAKAGLNELGRTP